MPVSRPLFLRANVEPTFDATKDETGRSVADYLGQTDFSPADAETAGEHLVRAVAEQLIPDEPQDRLRVYGILESAIGKVLLNK